MLESLINTAAGLQPCNFSEETPTQVFSCEYCEIFKTAIFKIIFCEYCEQLFKNSFFYGAPLATASVL